jgi:hypothetical protein
MITEIQREISSVDVFACNLSVNKVWAFASPIFTLLAHKVEPVSRLRLHGDSLVRKQILGDWERRILASYLKGERPKGYSGLLSDIRKMGLKLIIEGCERDLLMLRQLLKIEETRH